MPIRPRSCRRTTGSRAGASRTQETRRGCREFLATLRKQASTASGSSTARPTPTCSPGSRGGHRTSPLRASVDRPLGPLGAEHDAFATVDAHDFVLAERWHLRDSARPRPVRQDAARRRHGPRRRQVVPRSWVDDARRGDSGVDGTGMPPWHGGGYRDQLWVTGDAHGCFFGIGIYGQTVWMNPATDTVVARLSSFEQPDDDDGVHRARRARAPPVADGAAAAADLDVEAEGAQLLAAVVGDLVRAPRRHPDPVDAEVVTRPSSAACVWSSMTSVSGQAR